MTTGDDGYALSRPAVARRLRALGLDVSYVAGRGDILTTSEGREVLDLAGGFGATLLGHNHPRLVAVLRAALEEQRPMSAQMSIRREAGLLAADLAERLHQHSGEPQQALLYSTGAEAVEAAILWMTLDFERRCAALLARFDSATSAALRALRGAEGFDDLRLGLGARREQLRTALALPWILGIGGGYHGRTAGAASISAGRADEGPRSLRLTARFCARDDEEALGALCTEATLTLSVPVFDGQQLRDSEVRFCLIAGLLFEPIQGEGGVHVLGAAFVQAARNAADTHGFLLVADEIQCGLGRSGDRWASSVATDGVLLGKALGGSLVKLSALVARASRVPAELCLLATGTFVDDDISARVGREVLQLVDEEDVANRCASRGALLLGELRALQERHPQVLRAVRGRGLLVGVELGLPDDAPALLRLFGAEGFLAALVAGRLLHQHGIRTAPTLSALSVLRIEPSAFVEESELLRFCAALEESLLLLERGDVAALLAHVSGEAGSEASAVPSRSVPSRSVPAPAKDDVVRVAFLASLGTAADLRILEPSLGGLSEAGCERLVDRALPLLPSFVAARTTLTSATGAKVECTIVGVPFTAAQAMRALREGRPAAYVDKVASGAQLGRDSGACIIGFGGHTSIVAQLGGVLPVDAALTSGNALTAAAAAQMAIEGARRRGLPLRIGVVGAAGSIGALLTELLAETAVELVLVGRPRTRVRLQAIGERLCGSTAFRVAESMEALRDCAVIVTASNAPEPILLPEHLRGPALVVDVAVPGDAHPSLVGMAGVTVLRGGAVRLPAHQRLGVPGLDLGEGRIHACLAETLLCGLGGLEQDALSGSPSVLRARTLLALAQLHGFGIEESELAT